MSSSIIIKDMALKNRIVMAPMCQYYMNGLDKAAFKYGGQINHE